jgi:hypothetical protein
VSSRAWSGFPGKLTFRHVNRPKREFRTQLIAAARCLQYQQLARAGLINIEILNLRKISLTHGC